MYLPICSNTDVSCTDLNPNCINGECKCTSSSKCSSDTASVCDSDICKCGGTGSECSGTTPKCVIGPDVNGPVRSNSATCQVNLPTTISSKMTRFSVNIFSWLIYINHFLHPNISVKVMVGLMEMELQKVPVMGIISAKQMVVVKYVT